MMLLCYRIILIWLMLLGSHCQKTMSIEELSKKHKFLSFKDNQTTPLDKASKLSGLWTGRLAYVTSANDIYLATLGFNLKSDTSDNLFFDDFTFHKIVMPQINETGFNKKKTAGDSKIILASAKKIIIPSFKKDENELKKSSITTKDNLNLIDFTLDFSKEPLFKDIIFAPTKGIIWVSRDLDTIIGSDGDKLHFIAQRE